MKKTQRYVAGLAVVGTLAVVAVLAGARAKAQDVPPVVATGQFGMMGAARGEIARLSVSNINTYPPDPCRATLAFVDGAGDFLRRPDGSLLRKDVMLAAGHSSSLQFHANALLSGDENRLSFRPILSVPAPEENSPPDPCVPSLEIIDNASGQTRLVVPGSIRTYAGNHNETLVEDR
jgi:hypothetical protein